MGQNRTEFTEGTMNQTLSLRHWIKGAPGSGSNPLSPSYIASSLQVALSVSKQICDAEELSEVGLSSGLDSLPPPFPVSCIDWAGCITVDLKSRDDIEPLPLSRGNQISGPAECVEGIENEDVEELLDLLPQEANEQQNGDQLGRGLHQGSLNGINGAYNSHSVVEQLGRLQVQQGSSDRDNRTCNYHDVISAQIASNVSSQAHQANNHVDTKKDKQHRIYSLGLAFYELFSGGDLPPPELLVVASMDEGGLTLISMGNASNGNESSDGCPNQTLSNKRQNSLSSTGTASIDPQVLCIVNLENLRMKGVPTPLCDLISNMIDSINGEFMGNSSYNEIHDVTCDLQLMIDKPSVFLDGVDVNKTSQTGLQIDQALCELRDGELKSLQNAYTRAISGSSELALITGVSGTGKSTLANRFGQFVTANGGLFLQEKFDQMQVNSFPAVISAFNKYCEVLAGEEESEHAMFIAFRLRLALGQDLPYLTQMIPSLGRIIKDESSSESFPAQDCVNVQQRLNYLLCQFVEVICMCSKGPLVLFLDDVQWIDSESISIISYLLRSSHSTTENSQRLFFLGCAREMESNHPVWNMIDSFLALGFTETRVKLDCMDIDTVKEVLSNMLHLTPRLVHSLSEVVYHKTKGNPLFVTRMLLALNREGLLRINLAKHRWEWDEGAIEARKLPDDVAAFFIQSISSLPEDESKALYVLSCFGFSIGCEVIKAIQESLGMNLTESLDRLITEGLVSKRDGRYYFCHDRIQECAYTMVEEQDCCLKHNEYGMCLVDVALSTNNDALLLTAVTQINIGGPSAVQDADQYAKIAGCNLLAGKKAMEFSDYSSAFRYFDHGITFLRKKHWQDQYTLSLELYTLAAKCALANKDVTSLAMLCDSVEKYARNFEDTLETSFLTMTCLIHSKISDSVQYALSILLKLGVCIPQLPSREVIMQQLSQTQSMLNEMSDESILNYYVVSDYKKTMTIKFLARLNFSVQQVRPGLLPLVTIKMVRYSVEHGLSPMSAVGFAYFGGMVAELGDLRGGYRYTKLAMALLDKFQNSEIAGEVVCLTAGILSYIEPYQAVNEELKKGPNIALAAGDIHWACLNRLTLCSSLLWSGVKLSLLKEEYANAEQFMEGHRHLTTLNYIRTFSRTVSKLMGDERETLNDDEMTRAVVEYKNPLQLVIFYFHNTFIALIFNDYDALIQNAESFKKLDFQPWLLIASDAFQAFIIGLASFRIYRETRDPLWAERAKEYQDKFMLWSQQGSSWNFEHKSYLFQAEEAYSNDNFDTAQSLYDNAIVLAKRSKFIFDEALACELAANFQLKAGNKSSAYKYYMIAHEKYSQWGAFCKAKKLGENTQEIFGDCFPHESSNYCSGGSPCLSTERRKRELS